jgi:hypothetical protein
MYNVNLVFHGVFAFVLEEAKIDVLFPYYSPHEYLFGCWNDFEPLPKGDVAASGLDGIGHCRPYPDFDPGQVPTVRARLTQRCPDNLFCVLHLHHYPREVHYFRPYKLPPSAEALARFPYKGVHGDSVNLTTLAGPVVFRYTAASPDAVQFVFRKKPLKFNRNPEPGFESLNIHFFGEGEGDLPPTGNLDRPSQVAVHYSGAWTNLTSTIASLDVRLDKIFPFVIGKNPIPTDPTSLPDLPAVQLRDLDELLIPHPAPGDVGSGGDTDCDFAHVVIDNRASA